ncbi:S8 family serine peptidase [Agarivorans gilvus]|uniref:Peptidase S8/S53 domain-containing protein n=1 Tax=Agarivorans gilvus TaxID=680279 RepID=A0ABQ1I7A9_9ALTE|nr:S8 family serine peptidase [Agarivorans gilvus]GGB20247.1 hypothetical protein GCM10007414_37070 [Agarivorans gilvus]
MKTGIVLVLLSVLVACGGGGGGTVDQVETYSLSGDAYVLDNTVVDSDINDPNAYYSSNNSPATAQYLPPIAVVSGYLTSHATGISGDQFEFNNDELDIYRVDLEAGQRLFLEIADWEAAGERADFDLSLFTVDAQIEVASSAGVDKTELLTVETSGSYYLVVSAHTGTNQALSAGNYTLRLIAQNDASHLVSHHFSTQQDFVADEMIINHSQAAARSIDVNAYGLSVLSSGPTMSLYRDDGSVLSSSANARASMLGAPQSTKYAQKRRTLMKIKQMAHRFGPKNVSPNFIYHASALSNDPLVERQWHYKQINLGAAWQAMAGQIQNEVVVAVLDTGIYQSHPDLAAQLTDDGIDFISDTRISLDGDGIDYDPEDPGDQNGPNGSSSWHGTHVAGTIAAYTNNQLGVAGIAPNAKIMNLRVLGYEGGTTYDIAQAILYAAGLGNDSGRLPDKVASVINMSLGGESYDYVFDQAVQQAIAQGVIVVAAAGNESTSALSYPAAFANVIGVSAVDADKQLTSYSNFGSYIDIAAPGGDSRVDLDGDGYGDGVYSTYVNENGGSLSADYQYLNGTSMASPHVAGVVALMKQLNPNLDTDDFESLLVAGRLSDDLGSSGWDRSYGYGLLNAEKAVQSQIGIDDPERSYLSLSTGQISLNANQAEASFELSSVGLTQLSVISVQENAAWLVLDASATDGNGLGTYHIQVDRSGLSDGTYSTVITLNGSDGSSLLVSVSMMVTTQQAGDSGLVYTLLVDPFSNEVQYTQAVAMENGQFSFNFAEVAEGQYRLYVGTDNDNDYFLCDNGELCGAYPVRNDISLIDVKQNIAGLSLSIEPITTEELSALATSLRLNVK